MKNESEDCGNSPPFCQAQWYTPMIPALVRQEDQNFKASCSCSTNKQQELPETPVSNAKKYTKPVRIYSKDLRIPEIVSLP